MWQCPAHVDAGPSLSVRRSEQGKAIVHCHAGCATSAVMVALNAPLRYLSTPPPISPERYASKVARKVAFPEAKLGDGLVTQGLRLEAEHPYGSPAQAWLMRYRHPVTGAKQCVWESRNERGERVLGLLGVELGALPLYQERDAVAAAAMGEIVVIVESESSCDALRRVGLVAVTWAGGAGVPDVGRLRRVLGGHRRVVVIADGDEPGQACARRIAKELPLARCRFAKPGSDARDLLAEVGAARFRELIEEAVGPRK